jgi:hypothetical protein
LTGIVQENPPKTAIAALGAGLSAAAHLFDDWHGIRLSFYIRRPKKGE